MRKTSIDKGEKQPESGIRQLTTAETETISGAALSVTPSQLSELSKQFVSTGRPIITTGIVIRGPSIRF